MKTLFIKKQYFDHIASGEKTLEARINYPNLKNILKRDKIRFKCGPNDVIKTIKDVRRYKNLVLMLESEKIEKLLPGVLSKKEAEKIYESFYPKEKVESFSGMLVIELL